MVTGPLTFTCVSSTNHRSPARVAAQPGGVGQQRREPPLYPSVHGHMVDLDTAFGQQFLHVAIGQAEPQIPPHG